MDSSEGPDYDALAKKYGGTSVETPPKVRTVQIPISAIHHLRPDRKGSAWDAYTVEFPGQMTDEEILHAIQSDMLIPRPTFSLRAAIRSHLFSPIEHRERR